MDKEVQIVVLKQQLASFWNVKDVDQVDEARLIAILDELDRLDPFPGSSNVIMENKKRNIDKVSKRLSYLLRHSREPLYIDLQGGWAAVSDILKELKLSRSDLDEIVAEDTKGRYAYDPTGNKIRACQGHSIPGVVIDMDCPDPPEYLYHGTAEHFVDAIMREGLKPMRRQWVHISPDYETAATVGKRHGKPVVLKFRAKDFVRDGHKLYRSSNGVWQAQIISPEYLSICSFEEKIEKSPY